MSWVNAQNLMRLNKMGFYTDIQAVIKLKPKYLKLLKKADKLFDAYERKSSYCYSINSDTLNFWDFVYKLDKYSKFSMFSRELEKSHYFDFCTSFRAKWSKGFDYSKGLIYFNKDVNHAYLSLNYFTKYILPKIASEWYLESMTEDKDEVIINKKLKKINKLDIHTEENPIENLYFSYFDEFEPYVDYLNNPAHSTW